MAAITPFKIINFITDNKIAEKIYRAAKENPVKFASSMALTSALTKDALGCYYYVTQSLNNERIPEDKRNFVASIDLMNGIFNIIFQFSVGMWIEKRSSSWFDNTIGEKLALKNTQKATDIVEKGLVRTDITKNITKQQIENSLRDVVLGPKGKASMWLKVGFGAATMLIATQILTKRVLVPFLATPMAGWFKDHYMDKKKKGKDKEEINQKFLISAYSSPSTFSNLTLRGKDAQNKDSFNLATKK